MNALAVVAIVTFCATGSYAIDDITNCLAAADGSATDHTCDDDVKLCQVQTTYADNTVASVTGTTYACAPTSVAELAACTNTSETVHTCYCDKETCNDITQCLCYGTDSTRYANKMQNTDWATAENGARDVMATALTTILSAVGAFWLL